MNTDRIKRNKSQYNEFNLSFVGQPMPCLEVLGYSVHSRKSFQDQP